jgi:DNA polymerase-3 subunit epsilon
VSWLGAFTARGAEARAGASEARWVVVDVETTGLDVGFDKIVAIGAVAVHRGRIILDDSFATLVRPPRETGAANVLIHGISHSAQAGAPLARDALVEFIDYAGRDPLAAFHAPFDRAMLERAAREARLGRWRRDWLDVAQLLPVLFPSQAKQCRGLDDWLAVFSISHPSRHDAAADAYATAQLLQVALTEAPRQGFRSVGDLMKAGVSSRWIS